MMMTVPPCPAGDDVFLCRCTHNASEMLHGTDASLYPKSGCLRVGKTVLVARSAYSMMMMGRHLWEIIIENNVEACRRQIFYDKKCTDYCLSIQLPTTGARMVFPLQPFICGVLPIVHIKRIQRAMRHSLRRKRENRAIP